MLASLVGKNGTAILGLQKELKVGIQLNRNSIPMQLEIEAPDKDTLDAAVASLAETIKALRRGHWSSTVDPELIGLLIGKQGAKINKLRADTGAAVELDRRTGAIEVNGDEDKVAKARAYIEAFIEEHKDTACSAQVRMPAVSLDAIPRPHTSPLMQSLTHRLLVNKGARAGRGIPLGYRLQGRYGYGDIANVRRQV